MDGKTLETIGSLIWGGVISTGLLALVIWFLTRYIKQRDDFESKIQDQITKIPEKIKDSIIDIKEVVGQLKSQQYELKEQLRVHALANTNTQKRITEELIKIEKHIGVVEATLDRTKAKADQLGQTITAMSERVQFHDKALTNIVEWAKRTKHDLDALGDDYKSTKKIINEDLMILKKKKSD